MTIEKEATVQVLDKVSNIAEVKKFDESQNIYIYDLLSVEGEGDEQTRDVLASNRYSSVDDAPFELTAEELAELTGAIDEVESV